MLKESLSVSEKQFYRKKLDMKEEKILLSVGQFIYRKGYDVLIKALENIEPNIGVYIVGGKPPAEYITLLKSLRVKNIHFIDFQTKENLKEYYKASDLFVLPTREDIWGLVINEAMSYGLPVITTNKCGAGLQMIKDGINGKIVPVDDAEKLRDAIKEGFKLSSDEALQTAKEYSIENMAIIHLKYIKKFYRDNKKSTLTCRKVK